MATLGLRKTLPAKGCRVLTGPHRCADANLVVVPDLSILHDVGALAADVDLAVSFLYVVTRGIDVVTESQLASASFCPGRLSPSQCVRRAPALAHRVTFSIGEGLDVERPDVRAALRRIARAPGSRIGVAGSGVPASGGASLTTLRDSVEWALSARVVLNELGPKVLSADGARLLA